MPDLREMLLRFNEGYPTYGDIATINEHCYVSVKDVPAGTQVAAYRNKMLTRIVVRLMQF